MTQEGSKRQDIMCLGLILRLKLENIHPAPKTVCFDLYWDSTVHLRLIKH